MKNLFTNEDLKITKGNISDECNADKGIWPSPGYNKNNHVYEEWKNTIHECLVFDGTCCHINFK